MRTVSDVKCRSCGEMMEGFVQPALYPGGKENPLVTCWNEDCALCGYTLSAESYATLDLRDYLKKAQTPVGS